MRNKLYFEKAATDFLGTLDAKRYKQVVQNIFRLIPEGSPHDSKKLQGHTFHRIDSGEYRIIYERIGDTIMIVLVDKRNDDEVYKQLRRLT